jgi:hypothetical protein
MAAGVIRRDAGTPWGANPHSRREPWDSRTFSWNAEIPSRSNSANHGTDGTHCVERGRRSFDKRRTARYDGPPPTPLEGDHRLKLPSRCFILAAVWSHPSRSRPCLCRSFWLCNRYRLPCSRLCLCRSFGPCKRVFPSSGPGTGLVENAIPERGSTPESWRCYRPANPQGQH